jgi:predicted anti-sigma-YlaC factor YlaD
MTCAPYREAASARLDGEDPSAVGPGLDEAALDAHLAACPGCASWLEEAARVGRRTRLADASGVPDLTDTIVAAVAAEAPRPRRVELAQAGLAAVAVAQLVLAVSALAGLPHASREVGAWEAALAVGLLAVAARPERAGAFLPFAVAAAAVLVPVAVWDVTAGRAGLLAESGHLLLVAASLLLLGLRRWAAGPGGGGAGAVPSSREDGEGRAA